MSRVLRILPDVSTFAVDDGFSYLEPDELAAELGSLVRVPLGSRTVRGWVIGEAADDREGLRPIRRVSGTLPVFGPRQLQTYQWLAHHYVAPLASILRAATPPNLPTRVPRPPQDRARGRTRREHVALLGEVRERLATAEGSMIVIAPTAVEVTAVAEGLRDVGEVVVVDPGASDREVTKAWSRVRLDDRLVVIGTGRIATWWVRGLSTAVLLDEGRRAHKERQTPTLHPRTILSHRARVEGLHFITTGLVPTVEVIATGVPAPGGRRLWPLVEVVDRTEEPPGRGVISERAKQAIHHAVRSGKSTFVFTQRRGYAPAFRCTSCRELRRCASCGSAATNAAICPRCGTPYERCRACGGRSFEPLGAAVGRVRDLLTNLLGDERVGDVGSGSPVVVGTERDLAATDPFHLAVVIDADRILLGHDFRAAEDGLRLLARVAGLVEPGSGNRMMVQTAVADHRAIVALRSGNAAAFLDAELMNRQEAGMPPAGDLIVIETRGEATLTPDDVDTLTGYGATAFGPRPSKTGTRWLIQGRDLGRAKTALRPIVRRLRDAGSHVRVDVDPLEL